MHRVRAVLPVTPLLVVLAAMHALAPNLAEAHVYTEHTIGPTADWCARIQFGVSNGDLVRLQAGDYLGTCVIARSGLPDEGEPLAIVGEAGARVIAPPGRPALVVTGAFVRLGGLTLVGQPGAAVVEARGRTVLVDGCTFLGGEVGLDARAAPGAVSLIDNVFEGCGRAVDFTCPPEGACDRTRAVLRGNLVRSLASSDGAAVSLAAAVELVFEDNVIEGRWAVAAHLDGLDAASAVLEGNVVTDGLGFGRASALGLHVEHSPSARILNNAIMGVEGRAMRIDGSGALVVSNTLGASVAAVEAVDSEVVRSANAIAAPDVTPDDVDCLSAACWASDGDLRPLAPLVGRGPSLAQTGRDLCGRSRRNLSAAGAFADPDAPPMQLAAVGKRASGCFEAGAVGSLLASRPQAPEAGAGGCHAGEPAGWLAAFGALAALSRATRRRFSRAAR